MIEPAVRPETIEITEQGLPYGVIIPNPGEVLAYLFLHPDTFPIILPACAITRRHVGEEPQLSLELYRDPETLDTDLLLVVRANHYDLDFVMNKVIEASHEASHLMVGKAGWLLILTDFHPPR